MSLRFHPRRLLLALPQTDGDAAVDLDASNFTAFLQASQESFVVVEFFTHRSAPRL